MNKFAIGFLVLFVFSFNVHAATSRALILCGLPGDAEHEKQFTESLSKVRASLTDRFGFADSNVRVYYDRGENAEASGENVFKIHGRGTREDIANAAKWLVSETQDDDSVWVFVIGHAFFDERRVHVNIPDKDVTHQEFCSAFKKLKGNARFFICTPVSGYFIKDLSAPGRIIVTSTEADLETNGSIYHTALAKTLEEITPDSKFDVDKDGQVSWFDLYVKSTQHLADMYLNDDPPLIATEHPQIDDNGDGRGSEVQMDYLTIQQGGRLDQKGSKQRRKFADGILAAKIALPLK